MVIYLRHEIHGEKVASTDVEAAADRENGWVDFDPTTKTEPVPPAPVTVVEPVVPPVVSTPEVVPPAPESVVPSFLAPVVVESDLPADFPGRKALIEAGLPMWGDLIDKSLDELVALKGIGPATAEAIVKAMNS